MAAFLSGWIIQHIEAFGYGAVVLLMALESANIPIPSEITLPFAGFLVSRGPLNIHGVAFAGAFGCMIGSIPSYWLGFKLGRPFIQRFGKWFLIGPKQVALGDTWMSRYGNWTSFLSRLLPVVRTFISFVVGMWKAPFWTFTVLTFIGSLIWSYVLALIGVQLGDHWNALHPYWLKFEYAIIASIIIGVMAFVWIHWKQAQKP